MNIKLKEKLGYFYHLTLMFEISKHCKQEKKQKTELREGLVHHPFNMHTILLQVLCNLDHVITRHHRFCIPKLS